MNFDDLPDDAWVAYVDERQRRRYQAALAAHPDPRDPDHPEPEDYGLGADDE